MNKVILSGRLVRDPEMKYTQGGKAITTFSLAVQGMRKDDVDFIRITCFDKAAENTAKYTTKGSLVEIDGRIKTGSFEKDGQKVYTTDVYASSVNFLSTSKKENSDVEDVFGLEDQDMPF